MNPLTKRSANPGLRGKYILSLSMFFMIFLCVQQSQAQIIIEIEPPFAEGSSGNLTEGETVIAPTVETSTSPEGQSIAHPSAQAKRRAMQQAELARLAEEKSWWASIHSWLVEAMR